MAPSSIGTLVSFLLLLAPGALWQLVRTRHRPSVKETALAELARVVLTSLVATTMAGALLVLPVWLPLFRLAGAAPVDAPNPATASLPYLAGVLATSALACGLVLITSWVVWPDKPPIREGRVWNQTLVDARPKGADAPFLTVELLDGTIWRGQLVTFDSDPEDAYRNLALGTPLRRKRPNTEKFEVKDGEGFRFILLPEAQVKSIQVEFPPLSESPQPGSGQNRSALARARRYWNRRLGFLPTR